MSIGAFVRKQSHQLNKISSQRGGMMTTLHAFSKNQGPKKRDKQSELLNSSQLPFNDALVGEGLVPAQELQLEQAASVFAERKQSQEKAQPETILFSNKHVTLAMQKPSGRKRVTIRDLS